MATRCADPAEGAPERRAGAVRGAASRGDASDRPWPHVGSPPRRLPLPSHSPPPRGLLRSATCRCHHHRGHCSPSTAAGQRHKGQPRPGAEGATLHQERRCCHRRRRRSPLPRDVLQRWRWIEVSLSTWEDGASQPTLNYSVLVDPSFASLRNPFSEKKWWKFQISRIFSSTSAAIKMQAIDVHVIERCLDPNFLKPQVEPSLSYSERN